jgi:transcriptional regulator with XRE-family HTH domain
MTVKDCRISLGWSVRELAKRARVSERTIHRIERGEPVLDYIAGSVARALSEGLGRPLSIHDFEDLKIANP